MKQEIVKHHSWKKSAAAVLCALSIATAVTAVSVAPVSAADVPATTQTVTMQAVQGKQLTSSNWDPTVKGAINSFLAAYGNQSPAYNAQARPYAVFDFDNTTSILDMEEQLMIWQLDHLAFAIAPDQMEAVLLTGIPTDKLGATYGADDGSGRQVAIKDAIHDAAAAYKVLYNKHLVTPHGADLTASAKELPEYKEFTTKMRWLYDAIGETMDASVSYPWVTYWFTGMTPQDVYNLALACDSYYGDPAKGQTWSKGSYQSPTDLASQAGAVSVSYKLGVTVTPEIKELYGALAANGIDVWICSASPVDVIRAAKDYFHLPGVTGIVAMTNKTDAQGRYVNEYDYDLHAQTQGVGKALAISKVIAPKYQGRGPAFAAMDSQGDFNFCTEYKDTKEVLVVNRKRSDDAALTAGIAVWQKQHGITLAEANAKGDTLYVLQGRDENNGTFWPEDKTVLLGKTEQSFLSDKGLAAITQLDQGKSIAQVLKDNTKLSDYQGYKTR